MYEIYVPSFQDTDNDGIGDLTGVLNRIDYLKVSEMVSVIPFFSIYLCFIFKWKRIPNT